MTHVDLCCGTGAFSLAFESAGLKTVFASDIDKTSEVLYKLNFTSSFVRSDIHKLSVTTIPPHDVLSAGFPCQCYSEAGCKRGFDDERSDVFWKLLEIIRFHQPKYVLLENVPALLSHDSGETFNSMVRALVDSGYTLDIFVVNTSHVTGIPQNRKRMYVVCTKNGLEKPDIKLPQVTKKPLSDFFERGVDPDEYKLTPYKLKLAGVLEENTTHCFWRGNNLHTNKKNECFTLMAGHACKSTRLFIHLDGETRYLTPREYFNLQGFPSSYDTRGVSESLLYKAAGNAVTVSVAAIFAKAIAQRALKEKPAPRGCAIC